MIIKEREFVFFADNTKEFISLDYIKKIEADSIVLDGIALEKDSQSIVLIFNYELSDPDHYRGRIKPAKSKNYHFFITNIFSGSYRLMVGQ